MLDNQSQNYSNNRKTSLSSQAAANYDFLTTSLGVMNFTSESGLIVHMQSDQLHMAVFFLFLVKNDWTRVRYCTRVH